MKTIILFLSLVLSASAATLYPVLTDNSGRTFTGGATNLALLSGTNVFSGTNTFNTNTILGTAKLQDTLESKPTVALTNVAQLNQSQTFTGTPTFPAAVFASNNIGMRLLWSSPTNIYIPSFNTNASSSWTNNGDYALTTPIVSFQIPPLLGSNSALAFTYQSVRTNANSSAGVQYLYIGPNTNFIGSASSLHPTSVGHTSLTLQQFLQLAASWTNQVQCLWTTPLILGPTNFFDASLTNTVYVGGSTITSHTNGQIIGFKCFEIFAP